MSGGFPVYSSGNESACNAGDLDSIPAWEDPLEKDVATYSSVLAWRIPCTEKSGRLQSMRSQRVGHGGASNTIHYAYCILSAALSTASSFRIWNSSTGILSPPLAWFIVMLSKAHLTSHSRMSGSR